MKEILDKKVKELRLSESTKKWLKSRGVQSFKDIICMSEKDIKKASNLSEDSRKELTSFVHRNGFRFIHEKIDETLTKEEMFVGDLDIPVGTIRVLINHDFIQVNDLMKISRDTLIAIPKISEKFADAIILQINEPDPIIEEPTEEELAYRELMKRKDDIVARLKNATALVERLEKENNRIDQLVMKAEASIQDGKGKK